MLINKAILHVLDFNTNVCILSQKELDFSSDVVYEYVDKRINKIRHDASQQTGAFYATSQFQPLVQNLAAGSLKFDEFAASAARSLFDILSHCDVPESVDALVVDFQDDDDVRWLGILMLDNKTAYTHQILDDDGAIYNKLIQHQAILPGAAQKAEAYALINCRDFSVRFVDKKRQMDGQDIYILPDKLLQCTAVISSKDAVKMVTKIAAKVAEDHGGSTVEALSKTKQYLVENAETADSFSPQNLGAGVFADSPQMQEEFESQVREAQMPADVSIEKEYARKTGKNHKIKTDTGIEITFPSEYIENTDYIQIINNPDGTISIELKNICKITNK
ncbi:MAG: nucleoid-associated protein [Megasphaera sp.]|jgi:hypothetical protein|nr:nucleoid-associated protein [Megasphaera sp.]MCI1247340.1 nucleoid-associated protein [Megasphaera sp.]